MDSKILDIVTKWAEPVEQSESTAAETTEDESESLLTPPIIISTKNPVSILTSLRDTKPVKKKVKFADDVSSSDSESRTSELEFPVESDSVSSSSSLPGKQFKKKSFELRRKLLDKDGTDMDLKEILKQEVTETDDTENEQENTSQGEVTTGDSSETDKEATPTVTVEGDQESGESVEKEKEAVPGDSATDIDKGTGDTTEGEKGTEEGIVTESGEVCSKPRLGTGSDEVTTLATALLNDWANLKVKYNNLAHTTANQQLRWACG